MQKVLHLIEARLNSCCPKNISLRQMRFFSFFMSVYLMALCAIPCGDNKECKENEPDQICSAVGHEEHDHPSEACTPFCFCACCAASVIFQNINTSYPQTLEIQQLPIAYVVELYSCDFQTFWQPPKLG